MTKTKTTKRALIASVLSLLVCFTMLIGSTFAWFTDTASTGSSVIQSGTLDIVLEYWDGDSWENAEGKDLQFVKSAGHEDQAVLWEPGCTYALPKIRVRNEGNLTAKTLIRLNGITGDEKLFEVLEFKTAVANTPESLLTGSQANRYNALNNKSFDIIWNAADGNVVMDWTLAPKGETTPNSGHTDTSAEFTISAHMKEEAGNEYQNLKIEGIYIQVIATQGVYEYDSYGRDYDENAPYPVVPVADAATLAANTDETAKTVKITTASALIAFEQAVNGGNNYAGYTVTLANDIDLMNVAWTPIGQTGATEFKGVFDGNGKTILNLNIKNTDKSANCSSGLFGWIESHGSEGVTVKNLTVKNATVSGHHYVGVIVGYVYGTIENCHVVNADVSCTAVNDDANGDKCGLIAGYVGEYATIKNCTATDSAVSAGRDAGQIVGAAKTARVIDCSAKNVTVTANGTSTGKNINAAIIGRVL